MACTDNYVDIVQWEGLCTLRVATVLWGVEGDWLPNDTKWLVFKFINMSFMACFAMSISEL